MVLHVGDGVLDLQDLLGVVVGDFHVKGFFHGHDEFGEVEGVGTEVFNERGLGLHFFGGHAKLFHDDLFDLFFNGHGGILPVLFFLCCSGA